MQIIAFTLFVTMLPYLIDSSPGRSRKMNNFNEMAVLITIYCFICMNIVSVEINFMVGYFSIGFVTLYVLIRLFIIVREIYHNTKVSLRFCCAKRTFRKQRASQQKSLWSNHSKRRRRMRQLRQAKQEVSLSESESSSSSSSDD